MLTDAELKEIVEKCKFKPSEIGKIILIRLSYDVVDFRYSPSIYVKNKDGIIIAEEYTDF